MHIVFTFYTCFPHWKDWYVRLNEGSMKYIPPPSQPVTKQNLLMNAQLRSAGDLYNDNVF